MLRSIPATELLCYMLYCHVLFSGHFMALIAVIGFAKAITTGNSVPLAQELVGAERMMDLYALKAFVDGFGSAGVPFLAGK